MTRFAFLLLALAALTMGGCTAEKPAAGPEDIDALAAEIRALGPEVDPQEAARAARIAYRYPMQLAQQYQITDPPLIHNAKVTAGLRARGLCNHWAEDMEARLKAEGFRTLEVQRAISPPTPFRIIHHSAVITRPGDTIYEGIVVDPWRRGGPLFWDRTTADDRYNWRPRAEVVQAFLDARKER